MIYSIHSRGPLLCWQTNSMKYSKLFPCELFLLYDEWQYYKINYIWYLVELTGDLEKL